MFKKIIKRFIPSFLLLGYHRCLSNLGKIIYGNPSQKMITIGVTGTTGKSSVVYLISHLFDLLGFTTGASSTITFKIADQEWLNNKKMTMPGRFSLPRLLRKMVQANCQYAIVETSSEGIRQYRHLGINYDLAVFTNLSPEHLERHHGWKNYRIAKGKLFKELIKGKRKNIIGRQIDKINIVNLDDPEANYFSSFSADKHFGYSLGNNIVNINSNLKKIKLENLRLTAKDSSFTIAGQYFQSNLLGSFNVSNCLAVITVAISQGIPLEKIAAALIKIKTIPGRLEFVNQDQNFSVIVDYAHTPYAFKAIYQAIKQIPLLKTGGKIIHVLGGCGGGRDIKKRPILGKIAGQEADAVIITNEDPYDENPEQIINQVAEGSLEAGKRINQNLFKILNRRQAIKKALDLANQNDLVLITGKGSEQTMCVVGGKTIPWDDREIVRELLKAR